MSGRGTCTTHSLCSNAHTPDNCGCCDATVLASASGAIRAQPPELTPKQVCSSKLIRGVFSRRRKHHNAIRHQGYELQRAGWELRAARQGGRTPRGVAIRNGGGRRQAARTRPGQRGCVPLVTRQRRLHMRMWLRQRAEVPRWAAHQPCALPTHRHMGWARVAGLQTPEAQPQPRVLRPPGGATPAPTPTRCSDTIRVQHEHDRDT